MRHTVDIRSSRFRCARSVAPRMMANEVDFPADGHKKWEHGRAPLQRFETARWTPSGALVGARKVDWFLRREIRLAGVHSKPYHARSSSNGSKETEGLSCVRLPSPAKEPSEQGRHVWSEKV